MFIYTQEQRFLLKGIARLSARIHAIDDQDVISLQDTRTRIVLKRALKALLHDAAQEELRQEGYHRHVWHSSVMEMTRARTEVDVHALSIVHGLIHNPQAESVEETLTLFGKRLTDGRSD